MFTKKIISIALALVLIIMAGCSQANPAPSAGPDTSSDNPPATSSEAPDETDNGTDETQFEQTTLRFGTSSAEGTIIVDTMYDFADKVAAATGDKVEVQIFPSSQLGDANEIAQSAQMGAVDICMSQPSILAQMGVNEMSVFSLPYVFKNYEQRYKILTGEIGNELLHEVTSSDLNLVGLGYFPDGARNFFTVENKPIRSLADAKGMKLRVQGTELDTDMASALGASATPTAFSELYSALQSGVVDGAEQPILSYYSGKYYEVSKYLTLDEHTYNTLVVIFSKMSWDKLAPELQTVLKDCWDQATEEAKEKVLAAEAETKKKIEAEGVEIIEISDKDKWIEAMAPVYAIHASDLEDLITRMNAVD